MPKAKYDYNALKLEFFQSEEKSLGAFLTHKLGTKSKNGQIKKKTAGRAKEKKARLRNITDRALLQAAKHTASKTKIDTTKLAIGKKNAVEILIGALALCIDKKGKIKKLSDMIYVAKILDKLKIEMHEPIIISKNHNLTVEEDLTPEERAEIDEARDELDDDI